MNILPKKRWHVRTKDNIARVRRDEAQAKEEEQKRKEKLQLAESEARIRFLRNKSKNDCEDSTAFEDSITVDETNRQHVNLFADFKSQIKKTNKALEDEKREEKEKYEKQIGYLTYLGQDTNEALKLRSWYEVAPKRVEIGDTNDNERDLEKKQLQDPLTLINALIPRTFESTSIKLTKESPILNKSNTSPNNRSLEYEEQKDSKHVLSKKYKKHKKHKRKHNKKRVSKKRNHCKDDSEERSEERYRLKIEKLQHLRRERLKREERERARQKALLAPINIKQGVSTNAKSTETLRMVQKYNSQFNPEIAKQNMI